MNILGNLFISIFLFFTIFYCLPLKLVSFIQQCLGASTKPGRARVKASSKQKKFLR